MKKDSARFSLIEVIIFILITGIVCFITSGIIIYNNIKKTTGIDLNAIKKDQNIKKFTTAYFTLDSYYEKVNKNILTDKAIKAMLNEVNEKNTYYLSKNEATSLNNTLNDKYNGIGVVLNINNNHVKISEVYKNLPAFNIGIKPGDEIIKINDLNINNNYNILTNLFNNQKQIKIKVKRDNKYIDFIIKPSDLEKKNITYQKFNIDNKKILFIKINLFSKDSYKDFRKILLNNEKSGIAGLIIDIRDNNGGYLSSSKKIAEMFLEKNKNIYILKNKSETKVIKDKTLEKRNYDVVVLVNNKTASSAEVLAIALKESYGATLVGNVTYGKDSVQKTKKLDNGAMIKYTSFKWYSPNNNSIKNGIEPDIVISRNKQDNQLQVALNYFK